MFFFPTPFSGQGERCSTPKTTNEVCGPGGKTTNAFFFLIWLSDQVISENPANRGTETSAEVLVGPPWRMESNAGSVSKESSSWLST